MNWRKLPFEIFVWFLMIALWGNKATNRMLQAEVQYQKGLKNDTTRNPSKIKKSWN